MTNVIIGRLRKLQLFLCRRFPKYKLRCISKTLEIRPYDWQAEFALTGALNRDFPPNRCSGKTTAVMLRILMAECAHPLFLLQTLEWDSDWNPWDCHRMSWYSRHYNTLSVRCDRLGIPTIREFNISALYRQTIKDGCHEGCGRNLRRQTSNGKNEENNHSRRAGEGSNLSYW